MADLSASFNPAAIATTSDAASDAASKAVVAQSTGSDAASAASDALSKIAAVSDAASNAQSKITARSDAWDAKVVILKLYNEGSAIASGDGKGYFSVPAALNGMNLTSVGGHLYTAATSGVVQVQIRNVTSAVDMLSAAKLLEWDVTEKDTATAAAASAAVINTANDGVATGEEIAVDIDAAASGAKGMEIRLTFKKP